MHPANEIWRYIVKSSLIGWVHWQKGPWIWKTEDIIDNVILCIDYKIVPID